MKSSELDCLAHLEHIDGGHGTLPDGCDIAQLEADGLIQTGDGGRLALSPKGKLRLANLRTQEREYRRTI